MKVLLGGEGPTEIGDVSCGVIGVVEALLRRVCSDVQVVDCIPWKHIRKFQSGNRRGRERRNVLGLVREGVARGCDAVVFARDRDGDRDRERQIEDALSEVPSIFTAMRVVGGTANEATEAWLLALLGDARCEEHAVPKDVLASHGHRGLPASVEIAAGKGELEKAGYLAKSLSRWLGRARQLSGG